MVRVRFFLLILFLPLPLLGKYLFVDYSADVSEADLAAYDTFILSPDSFGEGLPGKVADSQIRLGYLSVCEISPDASYREEAIAAGVTFEGKNETWNSDLVDPGAPAWREFVTGTLAPGIMEKGFDGFFLDTAESVELLAAQDPDRADRFREGLVGLVQSLRQAYPEAKIVINRGFTVLPELYETVDGVLAESLYRSYDYGSGEYSEVAPAGSEWLLGHLHEALRNGLTVYVIDFLPRTEHSLAAETVERIRKDGFVPLISEPELMGEVVAPLPVVPRRILCLYGQEVNGQMLEWAEDTDTLTFFQLPLEYLGFELFFRSYPQSGLPESLEPDVGGIIIDSSLDVPSEKQKAFVDWLEKVKASGRKIFFVGSFPFLTPAERGRFMEVFGLEGTLLGVGGVSQAEVATLDSSVMGFETPVVPRVTGNSDVRAPAEGSEVFLEILLTGKNGEERRVHPVFSTGWGGIAAYPHLSTLNPERNAMLQVDPFVLMEKVFGLAPFPAPDTTTAQGRRIYFSHIDGDGFLNFSELSPDTRSGLVIQERVIEHYGLPVTVSFIESEIAGDTTIYEERPGESFVEEARAVFESPYVEPASHTYSHPFFWSYADPTSASYETQNVNIKTEYNYDQVSLPREIVDSVAYMNGPLKVPGKEADLLLWSGNCRAPPEALKISAEAGILNLNGGNTVATKRAPYLSLISPKAVNWQGQTQVYAPIQNENNFNNSFGNNRFGGFANVTQTFELTESPRRLKPLNVYYHFYSADRFDAFTALRKAIDYCVAQEMHPVWAGDFVAIVHDSIATEIYRVGRMGWRIAASGKSQTLRYPAAWGYPDLDRSRGVIGFSDLGDQRFVHLNERPRIDLWLTEAPPRGPYLASARATVEDFRVSDARITFGTFNRSRDPMAVNLAGMGSGEVWSIIRDGNTILKRPTADGSLLLEAPQGKTSWELIRRE